jgi:hypothetical protein
MLTEFGFHQPAHLGKGGGGKGEQADAEAATPRAAAPRAQLLQPERG